VGSEVIFALRHNREFGPVITMGVGGVVALNDIRSHAKAYIRYATIEAGSGTALTSATASISPPARPLTPSMRTYWIQVSPTLARSNPVPPPLRRAATPSSIAWSSTTRS
jgi:hypothetical protein